nr:hypothetical protein [Herbidospora sakaeratensis]
MRHYAFLLIAVGLVLVGIVPIARPLPRVVGRRVDLVVPAVRGRGGK